MQARTAGPWPGGQRLADDRDRGLDDEVAVVADGDDAPGVLVVGQRLG